MFFRFCALPVLLLFPCRIQAQSWHHNSVANASPQPYTIVSSGPHQNVWKQVILQTNIDGSVTPQTSSFTQLATGLNHLVNGQWVASSEDIQVMPNGYGAGTNTQHQVFFAPNINTVGSIDLIKPDGQHLIGTVLGLSLYDSSTGSNAIIAELQDSLGQILQTSNQVIYTNALVDSQSDFQADVFYTHKKSGFEQDIVLHQQPPPPALFGLNPATTVLQVWTEFVRSPDPTISTNPVEVQVQSNGRMTRQTVSSESLNFGSMRMDQGNAFANQNSTNSSQANTSGLNGMVLVPVAKHWIRQNGRKFLVEEVPFSALNRQMSTLPPTIYPTNSQAAIGARPKFFHSASAAKTKSQAIQVAKMVRDSRPALVLDYTLNNGSFTNFNFQSDTTYLIGSGNINLYGTTTFEGGTVIKYTNDLSNTPNLGVYGDIQCLTSAYRPAMFTSQDDDTVGAPIPGSSGTPGLIMGSYLYWAAGGAVSNLIFSYGYNGFSGCAADVEVWDCKFIKCSHPITANSSTTTLGLHNVLITMDTNINQGQWWGPDYAVTLYSYELALYGENLTADLESLHFCYYYDGELGSFNFTNSIFQCPELYYCAYDDNPTNPGDVTTSTNCVYFNSTPSGMVFQTMGAGNYYLAASSPCRGVGTTNLSPGGLAEIQAKTTWPPLVLSNTFSTPTVLSPEVPRDTNSAPDLGYHYPPIDFLSLYCLVSNTSLLLTNGVVIAYLNNTGLMLTNGSTLVSQGTPNQPNVIAHYRMIQEQATNLWSGLSPANAVYDSVPFLPLDTHYANASSLTMRFTTISGANGAEVILNSGDAYESFSSFTLRDCEIYLAGAMWEQSYNSSLTLFYENNLFHRPSFCEIGSVGALVACNNLFLSTSNSINGGDVAFYSNNNGPSYTRATNNAFDNCAVYLDGIYTNDAYLNGSFELIDWGMTAERNPIFTNLSWANGPLGYFYQPTNSALINKGAPTADLLGFYHYTTQTNEVPETNSIVDIGYHYVALGANGLPLSTSGDGIGDYLKDSNGDGIYESGTDLGNWLSSNTCGDGISDALKYAEGRSLNICPSEADTSGAVGMQVYTPLK